MGMAMQFPTEVFGSVVVVHTSEELGTDQADALRDFLAAVEPSHVVLDVDGTEAFDSAGLTALLDAADVLRGRHGDLKIATTNATNRKLLEITRLDCQLEVFDNVLDAVKSYR